MARRERGDESLDQLVQLVWIRFAYRAKWDERERGPHPSSGKNFAAGVWDEGESADFSSVLGVRESIRG